MLSPYNYINLKILINYKIKSLKILLFMKKIFIIFTKQYLNEDNIDIIQYFDNYYNDEDTYHTNSSNMKQDMMITII